MSAMGTCRIEEWPTASWHGAAHTSVTLPLCAPPGQHATSHPPAGCATPPPCPPLSSAVCRVLLAWRRRSAWPQWRWRRNGERSGAAKDQQQGAHGATQQQRQEERKHKSDKGGMTASPRRKERRG